MNNLRRFTALIMVLALALTAFAGCSKKESAASEASTPAGKLCEKFKEEIENSDDLEAIANNLMADEELIPFAPAVMVVEPGFLNGFNAEIKDFNKGVMFGPMIGSIPFIGYLFEADDAEALAETLKASAELNWNICTTADEMVCEPVGDYVFFVMSPYDLNEN